MSHAVLTNTEVSATEYCIRWVLLAHATRAERRDSCVVWRILVLYELLLCAVSVSLPCATATLPCATVTYPSVLGYALVLSAAVGRMARHVCDMLPFPHSIIRV